MGIEGWEEMKVCVNRGGIWHERLYGKTMKELWDEIVMQRRILDGESGRERFSEWLKGVVEVIRKSTAINLSSPMAKET